MSINPSHKVGAPDAVFSGLPTEVEKKYLLRECPDTAREVSPVLIEQGWLPGKIIRERVRRRVEPDRSESYWRTIKFGSSVTRVEVEEEIDPHFFAELWPLTRHARVRKNRHIIPDGSRLWEIDVFFDRPLVLAEIELGSENEEVHIPNWLTPYLIREVTGEVAYFNSSLAQPDA